MTISMIYRILVVLLALAAPALAAQSPDPSDYYAPVREWLPPESSVVLEMSTPNALLKPLLSQDFSTNVAGMINPQANPQMLVLQGIVGLLELQLGTDWRTALSGLMGKGLTVAVQPDGGVVLSVDAQDKKLLQQLHHTLRTFVAAQAAKEGHPERVAPRDYQGAIVWSFGTNEAHTVLGHRLLLANRTYLLERILDQRAAPTEANLTKMPLYQAARQALPKDTIASLFLDLRAMRRNPQFNAALAAESNPLATLLLAETRDALRQAQWLAAGFSLKNDTLVLTVVTDGQAFKEAKAAAFATPPPEGGVWPNLKVPGFISGASFYRDLRQFYASKDELFPERTAGLVFFENMMGIFFSGLDLTDAVLGQIKPEARLVVAVPQYDTAVGVPEVQVPAFALVLRLRQPESFGGVLEEAAQKAVGLANFTRGQKAQPGLVMDRGEHHQVKYTVASFRPPEDKTNGPVDARFNYRPTLARPGEYVIISSTDALAKDLIDALQKESAAPVKPVSSAHSLIELDGARLRAFLAGNREGLIRQNMANQGSSRLKAETEIGTLLFLMDFMDRASLAMDRSDGHPRATLELKFKAASNRP